MTSFADKYTKKQMRTGLNRMFRNYGDSARGFRISPEREKDVRSSTPTKPFYTTNANGENLRSSLQDPMDFTSTELFTVLNNGSGDRNAIRRIVGSSQVQDPPRTAAQRQIKGHLQKHNFMVPSENGDRAIGSEHQQYGQNGDNAESQEGPYGAFDLENNRINSAQYPFTSANVNTNQNLPIIETSMT